MVCLFFCWRMCENVQERPEQAYTATTHNALLVTLQLLHRTRLLCPFFPLHWPLLVSLYCVLGWRHCEMFTVWAWNINLSIRVNSYKKVTALEEKRWQRSNYGLAIYHLVPRKWNCSQNMFGAEGHFAKNINTGKVIFATMKTPFISYYFSWTSFQQYRIFRNV